jgi:LCP family protein required for cell wall assembly
MPIDQKNLDAAHGNLSPKIQIYTGAPGKPPLPNPKKTKKWPFWIILGILLIVILGGFGFTYGKNLTSQSFVGQSLGWFASAKDLFMGSIGQTSLEGEDTGWVNVLLLGIGGENHDGPYLSDTMILVQIKLETGQAVLTSIPRDYQVKLPKAGYRKINSAFSEGFVVNKDWNEAGKSALDAVSSISGLDIPYFAVIDFNGFEKAIDKIGGISINVPTSFTDFQYPDENEGYMAPQVFKAGVQTMDGSRALIYARSRHASGNQGSDFARSQRQQLVIDAVKAKIINLNLVTDNSKITELLKTFSEHFHTNLTPGQIIRLARMGQSKDFQTVSANLNPDNGLICPYITEETKAYVLIPCPDKKDSDIKDFFYHALDIGLISKEKSVVWIATKNPNSASFKRITSLLEQTGLVVWPLSYTDLEPDDTVLYEINDKPATKAFLLDALKAKEVSLAPPNIKIDATRSDIVIILGTNLPSRFTSPLPMPATSKPPVESLPKPTDPVPAPTLDSTTSFPTPSGQ